VRETMRETLSEKAISIPQVKEILEKIVAIEKIDTQEPAAPATSDEEAPVVAPEADKTKKYFLKSTYDYVSTFSKLESRNAKTVIENLVTKNEVPLSIAIQIVNINPDTQEELALLFEKSTKRPSSDELQNLLFKIREYREL
jgi:DNA-directed RNA polymerase subunit F